MKNCQNFTSKFTVFYYSLTEAVLGLGSLPEIHVLLSVDVQTEVDFYLKPNAFQNLGNIFRKKILSSLIKFI